MTMKICSKCKENKSLEHFPIYNRKPWFQCRQCNRAAACKKWREGNKEYVAKKNKDSHAGNRASDPNWDRRRNLRKYGITLEQYEAMYRDQNGACAACAGMNLSGRRLAVDHNHSTGEVRGLLCSRCNSAIGLARESADILKKLAAYLEKHETLAAIGAI